MQVQMQPGADHHLRNFAANRSPLNRGYSLQEPYIGIVVPNSCRRRSVEKAVNDLNGSVDLADRTRRSQLIDPNQNINDQLEKHQRRRATFTSGTQGRCQRPGWTLDDWPLAQPITFEEPDSFHLELNVDPFDSKEITTKLVGKDLIVHCKADAAKRRMIGSTKEVFRCYSLPLRDVPQPEDISVFIEDCILTVVIKTRSEPQFKPSVGLFVPVTEENAIEETDNITGETTMDIGD